MAAAAAAAAVPAARSAGKTRFVEFLTNRGRDCAAPVFLRVQGLPSGGHGPIIAALGGGPAVDVRLLRTAGGGRSKARFFEKPPRRGFFVKGGRWSPFLFAKGSYVTMREALMRLLEPAVEALHYELVDLEFAKSGRGGVLRLYIDRADRNAGPVTVEDCARVSRAAGGVLDDADPIEGHYSLEVSSPGVDRVLRTRAHFERFLGERVYVELKLPLDGRRRFLGTLREVADDAIEVEVDGRAYRLPLDRIQKARLRPE